MNSIANTLVIWYLENKRDLPWRNTVDPYAIWLSEIMLQQTRVAQGLPYYLSFKKAFPTVHDLANANEETVLKLWQGLGYYSRARNLHATAKYISVDLGGEFPKDYKGLLKLKGVGDYTASAIASICYKEPKAVLDGNVFRVLSRLFKIETAINSIEGKKEFSLLAQEVLKKDQPDIYNQAIMEFGALQCKPKNPNCLSCPLQTKCLAYKSNMIGQLPVKIKKTKVKKVFFNYLVPIVKGEETILLKRDEKGIWANLYEFPLEETTSELDIGKFIIPEKWESFFKFDKNSKPVLYNEKPIVHKLSHRHIEAKFWILEVEDVIKGKCSLSEIEKYPVPVLIANFIKEFKKNQ